MAIDINQLAERIADAVEAAPELAQRLVENPVATVEHITGVTGGYDLTELFGLCLARLAEAGVDSRPLTWASSTSPPSTSRG